MPFVLYVCPNFTSNAVRFIDTLSSLPDVRLGLVAQESVVLLPPEIQMRLAAFRQVTDVFNADVLTTAGEALQRENGPIHRILAAVEGLQVPLALTRCALGRGGHGCGNSAKFQGQTTHERLVPESRPAMRPFKGGAKPERGHPLC
ncbi:MAG: hypothetical protein H6569_02475 [Lewinellaceae bacterium]|nr:hypothetical protein [Lewinellaceae bacterium]